MIYDKRLKKLFKVMPQKKIPANYINKIKKQFSGHFWRFWGLIIVLSTINLMVMYLSAFSRKIVSFPGALIYSLADSFVLFLPLIWLRRRWLWIAAVWFLILSSLEFSNLLYFRNMGDFIYGRTYFAEGNVNGFVMDSATASMRFIDLIFLITTFAAFYIAFKWRERFSVRWRNVLVYVIIALSLEAFEIGNGIKRQMKYIEDSRATPLKYYRESFINDAQLSRVFQVYGFQGYILRCIFDNIGYEITLTEEDEREISELNEIKGREGVLGGDIEKRLAANETKNLIIVLVESLNTQALEQPVSGEVVPTLMNLIENDSVLYFPNIKSQIQKGQSSDGLFITMTGLLPLRKEPVVNRYKGGDFPALPKILNRYSLEYNGSDAATWNKPAMNKSYGFDAFLDETAVENYPEEKALKDSIFLKAVSKKLTELPEPFFVVAATVGMHRPYGAETCNPMPILKNYSDNDRHYLELVNAFDRSLSEFLDDVKDSGLYDNSVIVIVADHHDNYQLNKFDDDRIPMLILNSGLEKPEVKHSAGDYLQADIFPTLLDLTGNVGVGYRGLGKSMLRSDGIRLLTEEDMLDLSEKMIRSNTFPITNKQR